MKLPSLAIATLLFPALLTAQVERITVRLSPAPNQTLRQRTTHDMTMRLEAGQAGGQTPALPPMTIGMKTTLETTSTIGPADADGRYQVRLVFDSVSSATTMNGQPSPVAVPTTQMVGQVVTFSLDDQGKMLDVSAEGLPAGMAAGPLKQFLASAWSAAGPITLSVGETVTVPTQLNLPLPAGAPNGALAMTGEARYTLTSVTFDGADRIAHLTSKMTTALKNAPRPEGAGAEPLVDTTITSEGATDVNVDRGIVLHNEQRITIDGSMGMNVGRAGMPPLRMHGLMTVANDSIK